MMASAFKNTFGINKKSQQTLLFGNEKEVMVWQPPDMVAEKDPDFKASIIPSKYGRIDFEAINDFYLAHPDLDFGGGKAGFLMSSLCQLNAFNIENLSYIREEIKSQTSFASLIHQSNQSLEAKTQILANRATLLEQVMLNTFTDIATKITKDQEEELDTLKRAENAVRESNERINSLQMQFSELARALETENIKRHSEDSYIKNTVDSVLNGHNSSIQKILDDQNSRWENETHKTIVKTQATMEELFNTHSTKIQDIVGQIQMMNKEKEYSKGANRNEVQQLLLDVRKLSSDHKILEVDMKQTREAYIDINKKIRDLERTIQKDVKELHTAFKQRLKQEKQKDTSSTDQFEEIITTKKPEGGIYSQQRTPEINTKLDKRPLQTNANLQNIQTREKKTRKTWT